MKRKLLSLIPYAATLAVAFYALPPFARDTGGAILLLLAVVPLLTFVCAVVYGIREGLHGLLPLVAAVLFTPTVFVFYNASAWVYIPLYAAVALTGNLIGRIFYKKNHT